MKCLRATIPEGSLRRHKKNSPSRNDREKMRLWKVTELLPLSGGMREEFSGNPHLP